MRLVSSVGLLALVVGSLMAQAPIGVGPGGKVDVFDWYSATASGCTAGAGQMCVGGGSGSKPQGDTYYFTGWLSDGTLVGSFNDGYSVNCSGNMSLLKLVSFDWSNRNASKIAELNCMSDYSPGSDSPAGWYGHCTSGDEATTGNVCGWKSRTPFAKGGCLYLPVERQIGPGTPSVHDATLIVSCDGGQTWKNPYTVAHGGAASATGDAPKCGAASGSAGVQCLDASYPGSIMWPNMSLLALQGWMFYQYGQDGSLPTGIDGDYDPGTYTCAMLSDGSVGRVLNTDLPSLDVSNWQYVASTDAQNKPTWTSTFVNRHPVVTFSPNSDADLMRPRGICAGPTYIKEFKSYLLIGFKYSPDRIVFMTSPGAFGPWKTVGIIPGNIGFSTISLGVGYTVVSTSPPHIQVTVVADYKGHAGAGGGVPTFSKYDIVLGTQPDGNGDVPTYTDTGMGRVNSGWQFTAGDVPGTFNRKGLVWAFDFMDHGGVIASNYPFFHDVANNNAIFTGCFTDGAAHCGDGQNNIKGDNLLTIGIQTQSGYAARYESNVSDLNWGATAGNQNAPSAMQGNGTFTVAGVFRFDGSSSNPIWATGNLGAAAGNAGLMLDLNGGNIELVWANNTVFRWFYRTSWTPTLGNWYYIAVTFPSGTPDPSVKVWIGAAGALTDVMSGVARAKDGGSPTQTPNVAASPFILGYDHANYSGNISFAALLVYNRALSDLECNWLYQSLKAKMAERGVTMQ